MPPLMSYLRMSSASSSRSLGRKPPKAKKKTQVKKEWDNSVQDLSVHRATTEELVHRHEIHKSKNRWLAQWELKNKARTKQNRGSPDPLEKTRLAIIKEILSDQYQMNDVLERSDRALAVVKDLFGDAPRRHTGFPNVTMAPSCDLETSRGPIAQKKDLPTRLSVLSESIMDSQALNEVEETFSQSEHSDYEPESSISFQPDVRTGRARQMLDKERPPFHPPLWSQKDSETFATPCKPDGETDPTQTALNATTAVNRVKSRVPEEEQQKEEDSSSMIGQVLNPQNRTNRRLQPKGKKKRFGNPHSSHSQNHGLSKTCDSEISACSQSSMDILNQMIQEVEQELAGYECQTGREVVSAPQAHGLTGFSLSLVGSIKRMVCYFKEVDKRLHQEVLERQRLQEELSEQRLMIDALTAEILTLKDGNQIIQPQSSPNQCPAVTQEQLPLTTQALERLSVASDEQPQTPTDSEPEKIKRLLDNLGLQIQELEGKQDRAGVSQGMFLSSLNQKASPVEETRAASALPLHVFQPAVMLSPPRQKTRPELSNQSGLPRRTLSTMSSLPTSVSPSSSGKANHPEIGISPRTMTSPNPSEPVTQHCRTPQDLDTSNQSSAIPDLPQACSPSLINQHILEPTNQDILNRGPEIKENFLQDVDLASQLEEMAKQNAALKAQLQQFNSSTRLTSPGRTDSSRDNGHPGASADTQNNGVTSAAMSLEMRIAELNRQSLEARNKLLNLIERQKQSNVVSPAISPITPQTEHTGSRRRTEEVSVPSPHFGDVSLDSTLSSVSRSGGRRSPAVSNRTGSSWNSSIGSGRPVAFGQWPQGGSYKSNFQEEEEMTAGK
ncbi:spindle and centriole-associated protein 1 [Rhinophrynus dorsalis]